MLIQDGLIRGTRNDPDWKLYDGNGVRQTKRHVRFPTKFTGTPRLVVSISNIDILNDSNSRLNVFAENVDANGFELVFETWDTTQVWGANATWLAYGD